MEKKRSTAKSVISNHSEPDYFRLDVGAAYKQLRLDRGTKTPSSLKVRVHNKLLFLTQPDHTLKRLQGISLKDNKKYRVGEKTAEEIKDFVYEIGGWFQEDSENIEFIKEQKIKGEAFGEKYKNAPFYANARRPAEEGLDPSLVDKQLRKMAGKNYSRLFSETKSDVTVRVLGTESLIYNSKPNYRIIADLAFRNHEELIKQGYTEKEVEQIGRELTLLGLELDIVTKAKNAVHANLTTKSKSKPS